MRNAGILIVTLTVAAPAFAEQARPMIPQDPLASTLRQYEASNPYRKLFAVEKSLDQVIAERAAVEKAAAPAKPRVVCGMLIVPVNPEIDPKMLITPPQNPNVEYRIRTLDPPTCNPAK